MADKNKTTILAEPGKQEMLITREFDAPRELVFKAFTDPELYVQCRACEFTRNTGIALMERIAILCPEVREHPALSPFFSIPEKANKRVKRVNSQALRPVAGTTKAHHDARYI